MDDIILKNYTLKNDRNGFGGLFCIPDPNERYCCNSGDLTMSAPFTGRYCVSSDICRSTGFDYIHNIVLRTRKHPEALDILKEYLEAFPEKINCQNNEGYTALMLACKNSNRNSTNETVELLLAHPSIDVNLQNSERQTALYIAYIFCNNSSTKRTLELLLAHPGIDVNLQDSDGWAILHHACRFSKTDSIGGPLELLLAHPGIDVNLQTNYELTTLHWACANDKIKIIEMLLERPAIDVNLQEEEGKTILHEACKDNKIEIVKMFLSYSNNIN